MKFRRNSATALLTGLALIAASCGSGSSADNAESSASTASSDTAELAQVKLLLPFPMSIPYASLIAAQENGYLADAGIELTTDVADGSGFVSLQLVAGNIDFGLMSGADIVVAASKRDDIRVVMCHQVKNVYRIVATAESGIKDIAGLAGNTLGITEPGGGENQYVVAALAEAGLESPGDVTVLPIGAAGPQSLTALEDDTVQAYSSSFPDIASLSASGLDFIDITPATYSNLPGTCIATTQEVLDAEGGVDRATALTTAWVNGQYFALENDDEAYKLTCDALPAACENEVGARALFDETMNVTRPAGGARPGEVKPESWVTMVEVLSASGIVEPDLDMAPVVSNDQLDTIREAAYAGH